MFTGQLPREELADVYCRSTVLAVSSRHEAQSMVAVEAAACGLPVVGTAVGVLPDLDGAASTVPVGDHRALAAALRKVIGDPIRAARMGHAGREVATARFDLGRSIRSWTEAYARVMGS